MASRAPIPTPQTRTPQAKDTAAATVEEQPNAPAQPAGANTEQK